MSHGLTHATATLIHTNPHLNDVVASKDHRTQLLFILGDQSLLCTPHLSPFRDSGSGCLSNQSQQESPTSII